MDPRRPAALLLATGAGNTAVGRQAGDSITTGANNLVLGNGIGAGVGLVLHLLLGSGSAVMALAVAITILLGQQLRCLHPPAGGLAFLVVYLKVGPHFLVFPVLIGSLLLVLLAWAFSRWVPQAAAYPRHWL